MATAFRGFSSEVVVSANTSVAATGKTLAAVAEATTLLCSEEVAVATAAAFDSDIGGIVVVVVVLVILVVVAGAEMESGDGGESSTATVADCCFSSHFRDAGEDRLHALAVTALLNKPRPSFSTR